MTILQWSFVRDDQPRATTCRQIALALRDEVCDLEKAVSMSFKLTSQRCGKGCRCVKASGKLTWIGLLRASS